MSNRTNIILKLSKDTLISEQYNINKARQGAMHIGHYDWFNG